MSRTLPIDFDIQGESRLAIILVSFSLLGHVAFFSFYQISFQRNPDAMVEEWTIDTELISDFGDAAPSEISLPDSTEDEKVALPSNMLPQLTKKYSIKEKEQIEKGPGELTKEELADQAKEGEKDAKKAETSTDTKDNQLDIDEIHKRQALERLRKLQKLESKDTLAPSDRKLAIADYLRNSQKIKKGTGGSGLEAAANQYRSILQKTIRRHYLLPKTYRISDKDFKVILTIVVGANGDLTKVRLYKASEDDVLNEYTIRAAKSAAPYPPPPKHLAGRRIHLQFSNKNL